MFGIDFQNLYGVWLDPSIIGSSFLKDFGTLARTHCAGKGIHPKSYKNSNESCNFDVDWVVRAIKVCFLGKKNQLGTINSSDKKKLVDDCH